MNTPPDLPRIGWVKSTYSNGDGGNCIEWAPEFSTADMIPVRDSKIPGGPALLFSASSWSSFISAVKGGRLPGA
ncbi:DUF397 domain-containing protein [Streptomyces iranensis]|uniref:DUF397 domain-containing protein n=1 Tax=Streptomyces iranensis TaxID=576784 RepID=UPI0039B72496